MYAVYVVLCICAACIAFGLFYRLSACLFFLLFTYVELLDKAFYLNHYYLVSLLTFWMALVPAHHWYSLDVRLFPRIKSSSCSNWHILIFKVQLSVVYFFAGLAKVNSDWLFRAQPMATWLPSKYELPILGRWVHLKATAYLFSWAGCAYDLFVWLFLWVKKTRKVAYFFVVVFHVLTGILFPRIGMFPYIMIISTIIFFSSDWHQKLLNYLPYGSPMPEDTSNIRQPSTTRKMIQLALALYLLIQLYLPFRYVFFAGNLFWQEQGYRFSWRVMLMEKNGYTSIIVRDPMENMQREVDQDAFLTPFQKKQMKSQPDMILQFARYIGDQFYLEKGYKPEVYVSSRMSLNGRRSQWFTNEKIDVYNTPSPRKQGWIIPLQ